MSRNKTKKRCMLEARLAMLGAPQQIGYGKNYHTEKPDPINWENLDGLDHFIIAQTDGSILAGLNLPGSDLASFTYRFETEAAAELWLRNASEKFRIARANQNSATPVST